MKALQDKVDAQQNESEALRSANAELKKELDALRDSGGDAAAEGTKKDDRIFLPLATNSPYFPPPKNRASSKPCIAPLKGDQTADALTGEALAEYQTAHWVCSALHDVQFWTADSRQKWYDAVAASEIDDAERSAAYLEAAFNHMDVAFELLLQRLEVVRTRVHLKSKQGGLTVTDTALLDFVNTQLYGMTPDMNVLDPSVRKHIEAFNKKVLFSKLNAGAKASLLKQDPSHTSPKAKDRKQRKERLKREAAAKAKALQLDE